MTDRNADSAVMEQAKGVIMLRYGVCSYESLAAMARWAREAHVTLEEVAHALVKGICQGRVTPESQGTVRWLEQRLRADIGGEATPSSTTTTGEATRRRGTAAERTPPRASVPSPAPAARQWRYTSAVHAARALGSP